MASRFRKDFFDCLTARGDELFELVDALLCADGPVTSPVVLALVAEHRRGHGAMYEALNHGSVDVPRLRQVLAGLPMPRAADGRLVLAVDVSNWLRPDAPTSAKRLFCHVYGRSVWSSDQSCPSKGAADGTEPDQPRQERIENHLIVNRHGLPVSLGTSAANLHDSQAHNPLARGIPPIRFRHGRRRRRPAKLHGGKGYDCPHLRRWLSLQ